MRRDKTLKICANHYISKEIILKPNVGSEKSWVYTVDDYSEGVSSLDLLAVRFGNEESMCNIHEQSERIIP
jgi:Ran-binding protein 1